MIELQSTSKESTPSYTAIFTLVFGMKFGFVRGLGCFFKHVSSSSMALDSEVNNLTKDLEAACEEIEQTKLRQQELEDLMSQ